MTDTFLKLQKPLPEATIDVLRTVTTIAESLSVPNFLVGATARDVILEYVYKAGIARATGDIDFGVAVASWAEYEKFKEALVVAGNFRPDNKIEQRLWRGRKSEEMKIDIVPYGGLESPAGKITFPPTQFEMNTSGFAEAYDDALLVQIADELKVRIVSLAGLAVLKFIAYNDRPQERQTDLQDIWFLAKNYLDAGNEQRLYEDNELLNDESFDIRTVGARMLGYDMAKLLTRQTKEIILNHLSESKDDNNLTKIAYIIGFRERGLGEETEEIIEIFQMVKKGIIEKSD